MKKLFERPRREDVLGNLEHQYAQDYQLQKVIKPIIRHFESLLAQHVDRILEQSAVSDAPVHIAIPIRKKLELIRVSDIIRLESKEKYTYFHLENGGVKISCKSLSSYQELLGSNFVKVHRAHLISLDRIKFIQEKKDGFVTMQDDHIIPVSREHLPHLKRKLNYLQ